MKYEVIKDELHPVIRSRSSSASDIHVSISGPILYPHQQTGLKLGRNRPGHNLKIQILISYFLRRLYQKQWSILDTQIFFRQKTNRIKDQTKKLDFLPTPNNIFLVAQKRTIPCDQNALLTKMIIKINFKYVTTKKVHKDSVLLIYHCKTHHKIFLSRRAIR